jgi:dissimilatory sulfite reductase (desulfoviridin) alpha/beta subunit
MLPKYHELEGFVYKITNLSTGQIYIGKKSLFHTKKKRISQREKTETKTRKTFEFVKKESDWLKYYGSSKTLTDDVKKYGVDNFRREILELCKTKKYLSYAEFAWQVKLDVLRTNSYNGNILGKWYSRDME